ncbi:MAG: hypothetical protein IPM56_01435 [Ignavibacteriales bacterium]|nr:MAG: hypothetical protein IPM56_01435 [Ignavibacteriales bacterium]
MNREKINIEAEIEQTIKLFDSIETLEPDQFMYTRVKAQVEESAKTKKQNIFSALFKVARVILFILLLTVNLYSVIVYFQGDSESTALRQDYLDSIKTEYSVNPGYSSYPALNSVD